MQYILEHRIGDGDAPNFVEKENATSTKSASSARALVDALRPEISAAQIAPLAVVGGRN